MCNVLHLNIQLSIKTKPVDTTFDYTLAMVLLCGGNVHNVVSAKSKHLGDKIRFPPQA